VAAHTHGIIEIDCQGKDDIADDLALAGHWCTRLTVGVDPYRFRPGQMQRIPKGVPDSLDPSNATSQRADPQTSMVIFNRAEDKILFD
jgi:hypothetical protein